MPGTTFLSGFYGRIRRLMRENPEAGPDEVEAVFRTARAAAGGLTKAERARERAESDDSEEGENVAASEWYEDRSRAISAALQARYGQGVFTIRTSPTEVIYEVWQSAGMVGVAGGQDRYYRAEYEIDDAGRVTFGEPAEVEQRTDYVPVTLEDDQPHYQARMRRGIRLDDAGGLPEWQQVHEVGEWAVAHGSGQRIVFTEDMGDEMIANFQNNVIGRRVPLDEIHSTGKRGRAIGWLQELRWGGGERDGLPGQPEPDGITKRWLYGRWTYTPAGTQMLSDAEFAYVSPEYQHNYVRKRDGRAFGAALLAVAATNDPFLRLRSLQGEPSLERLALSEGDDMNTATTPPAAPPVAGERTITLAEFEAFKAEQAEALRVSREEARRATVRLHEQKVEADVRLRIERGLPPALASLIKPVMLACDPEAAGTIRLSEDPGAEPTNFYGAMLALMDRLPTVNMSARTIQTDRRPGSEVVNLSEAIEAGRQTARTWRQEAGLQVVER